NRVRPLRGPAAPPVDDAACAGQCSRSAAGRPGGPCEHACRSGRVLCVSDERPHPQQVVKFAFYKADRAFRAQPADERSAAQYEDRIGDKRERLQVKPGRAKYLFVYPFVKTRAWYMLPFEERQKMMDVHIEIGHRFPTVKLNTTYSFGLDDQEFVVAFETDHAEHFLDLVMELREARSSEYTLRDTPIFSCIAREPLEVLDSI